VVGPDVMFRSATQEKGGCLRCELSYQRSSIHYIVHQEVRTMNLDNGLLLDINIFMF